jgi:hypothetical protein
MAFVLEVVHEISDFKEYVNNFHHDNANSLIGLGDMHLFMLYVEEDGDGRCWPIIQYKVPLHSQVIGDFSLSA